MVSCLRHRLTSLLLHSVPPHIHLSGFHLPFGSASVLSCTGSTSDPHHHDSVSSASGVTLYHRLSFCALGSIRSCSVGHLQDVVSHSDYTLAPPTLDSAVGCHPCFALGLHQWAVNIIATKVSSSSCHLPFSIFFHHPFACSSCHLFVISSKDPTFHPSFVCLFLFGVRSDLLEGTLCHKYVQLISFFIDF